MYMRRIIYIGFFIFLAVASIAQQDGSGKTIDITSSFKPNLLPPKKILPTASPFKPNAAKETLVYEVPVSLLSFKYVPSPLRPLAFYDTTKRIEDKGYIKAGFGNYATPFVQAAINYGNGQKMNGNAEAMFTRSKGNLPFQEFTRYGMKTQAIFHVNEDLDLQGRAGVSGQNLFRYGFKPDSLKLNRDSLRLNYLDFHFGGTIGNKTPNKAGVFYKADVDLHLFSDNLNGNETSFAFDAPIEKELNDKTMLVAGLGGMLSRVNGSDTSFANNVTMLSTGVRYELKENMKLNALVVPAWHNGTFHLLPIAQVEMFLPVSKLTLEAGITGGFVRNSWQLLAGFNPWMAQPSRITHSRNMEYAFSVKGNLDEHWFFRLKGGVNNQSNVPLFVNDTLLGNSFSILWEPRILITSGIGELVYQYGEKFIWNTQMTVRGFSKLREAEKAFGLIPFEIQSSVRGKLTNKLMGKLDFYHFYAPWHLTSGKTERGGGGLDMSFGAEYLLKKKWKLWLQLNNVFNDNYQRWNQFPVLGFQVIGGVICNF